MSTFFQFKSISLWTGRLWWFLLFWWGISVLLRDEFYYAVSIFGNHYDKSFIWLLFLFKTKLISL